MGKDGVARGALVRVEDKAKRSIVIERPAETVSPGDWGRECKRGKGNCGGCT